MAAAVATVGAFLNLVGPLTSAVTQVVNLASSMPAVQNLYPGASPALPNNLVNLGVGLYEGGVNPDDTFGGDGINVNGFLHSGTWVGSRKGPPMSQGQTYGLELDSTQSSVGNVQVWELTLAASGANDVCIQYVELAWMGTLTSGFDGSWGKMCGQDWYWSESTWGSVDGKPYRPECWWISNVSKTHKTQAHPNRAMWANMELLVSGANTPGANTSTATFCSDQVMKFSSTTPVDGRSRDVPGGLNIDAPGSGPPGPAAPPPSKRNEPRHPHMPHYYPRSAQPTGIQSAGVRPTGVAATGTYPLPGQPSTESGSLRASDGTAHAQLIVSDIEDHSAQELCDHPNSRGPDFVHKTENLFCDMTERKTYPLCNGQVQTNCFALDQTGKKIKKRGSDETGRGDALHRNYHSIKNWTL